MRSSKSRSRNKGGNRNRSVGNVINRVFDSSGPEGKVRGTPQQIIDKYTQLTRDATLSNDRVAAENFQQHGEHYIRMLGEATREMEAKREQQERENRERQQSRQEQQNREQQSQPQPKAERNEDRPVDPASAEQPEVIEPAAKEESNLVETPEAAPAKRKPRARKPKAEKPRDEQPSVDQPDAPEAAE